MDFAKDLRQMVAGFASMPVVAGMASHSFSRPADAARIPEHLQYNIPVVLRLQAYEIHQHYQRLPVNWCSALRFESCDATY